MLASRFQFALIFCAAAILSAGCVDDDTTEFDAERGLTVSGAQLPAATLQGTIAGPGSVDTRAAGVRFGQPSDRMADPIFVGAIDLAAAIGETEVMPVGVTIEESQGKLFVLDAIHGLYELNDTGATKVWALDAGTTGAFPASAFTDVVATAPGYFALTALSDGFLLHAQANTLMQYFCYEPGGELWPEDMQQLTNGVAHHPSDDILIAQPSTFFAGDPSAPFEAFVATYSRETGDDLDWYLLPDPTYSATGIVVETDETLLLAGRHGLDRFHLDTGALDHITDLARYGVKRAEGMALDPATGHLHIIDGASGRLVTLNLD